MKSCFNKVLDFLSVDGTFTVKRIVYLFLFWAVIVEALTLLAWKNPFSIEKQFDALKFILHFFLIWFLFSVIYSISKKINSKNPRRNQKKIKNQFEIFELAILNKLTPFKFDYSFSMVMMILGYILFTAFHFLIVSNSIFQDRNLQLGYLAILAIKIIFIYKFIDTLSISAAKKWDNFFNFAPYFFGEIILIVLQLSPSGIQAIRDSDRIMNIITSPVILIAGVAFILNSFFQKTDTKFELENSKFDFRGRIISLIGISLYTGILFLLPLTSPNLVEIDPNRIETIKLFYLIREFMFLFYMILLYGNFVSICQKMAFLSRKRNSQLKVIKGKVVGNSFLTYKSSFFNNNFEKNVKFIDVLKNDSRTEHISIPKESTLYYPKNFDIKIGDEVEVWGYEIATNYLSNQSDDVIHLVSLYLIRKKKTELDPII